MADKLRATPVPIDLDRRRKLVFRHRELRDLVRTTEKSVIELYQDPFNGWPYLLMFGLRYQDLKVDLDAASDMIDGWVEAHKDERYPLRSLGEKLIEALNGSGMMRLEADGARDSEVGGPEGEEQAAGNAATLSEI